MLRSLSLVLCASVVVAAACGVPAQDSDAGPAPVAVRLGDVSHDAIAQPVTATGVYGSRDEVALSFKIGGVIARLAVDEGDAVQRGQLLAALDLREIDALRAKAQVGVDKATRDVLRLRALFADSVVSRAQLQDAESALAAAEADLATAVVNRNYAVITAPGTGRVLRRRAQVGALVGPGQEVLLLGNDTRGRVVRAGLPDRDAVRVRPGQSAVVTFDALPGREFDATVVQRAAATDARTGTVSVELAVPGADALPSGAVARVRIAVEALAPASLVPIEAILEADGDSATVFTVRDGRAERHRVQVRFLAGARVAVSGLDSVTRVVTDGGAFLAPDTPVRVVEDVR